MSNNPTNQEVVKGRNTYLAVASGLQFYQNRISEAIANAKANIDGCTFESSFLKGDHYTTYCDKKNDWLDQHKQLIESFESFLPSLRVCIQNAKNRANSF